MTPGEHFTLVSLHAHPDDEALLTAGTLARAAAEGHRVVLVVATDGEAGLSRPGLSGADLAAERRVELQASAAAIGAKAVYFLGYADSGYDPDPAIDLPAAQQPFAGVAVDLAAERLSEILAAEQADVLTIYDQHGGYGHPDHVQVHRVGLRAAELAGTPVVLEATIDRDLLSRAVRTLRGVARRVPGVPLPAMPDLSAAFLPRSEITHRVDVRAHLGAKLEALCAHRSQAEGGSSIRTVALLVRLPRPLRRRVLGTEWFREVGRAPVAEKVDDVFATLRARPAGSTQVACRKIGPGSRYDS